MKMDKFKGYYKKTRLDRIKALEEYLSYENYENLLKGNTLTNEVGEKLVENELNIFGLPFSVAPNFLIDGVEYILPMVTEEPSVVAAASNAAKIIASFGGFETKIEERIMVGQIAFYSYKKDKENILKNKEKILELANKAHEGIVKLEGGAKDLEVLEKDKFLIVYLYVDTKDAMGANIINTMLEEISPVIESLIEGKKLMSILSNYSNRALVKATCKLQLEKELRDKMKLAIDFANVDVFRAVTNNKGIFNGIDAIAIATGNDNRAISAAGHSYAAKDGKYMSLSKWYVEDEYLIGELEMPMPIASVGGSIGINPLSRVALNLLGNPDAKTLAKITVCLGLAQNFAALKALVSEGIQRGHMKLHANSVAIFAGAKDFEVEELVKRMLEKGKIEILSAKELLKELRDESNI